MDGAARIDAPVQDNVALARQHIARQKEIIELLKLQGQSTALAEDVLKSFERTLQEHIRLRALSEAMHKHRVDIAAQGDLKTARANITS
jgi:hypothetical protein